MKSEAKLQKNETTANNEAVNETELLYKKVAERFRVTTSTIDRWVREKKLKAEKRGAQKQSHVLFEKSEVERFYNEMRLHK